MMRIWVLLPLVILPLHCAMADYRQQAIDLGREIDAARQQPMAPDDINAWLARVDALAASAEAERLQREAVAREDESQLERLYRSPIWSDIGFARAAARYWRGWLLLDRYQTSRNPADLEGARNGFQTILALIVYPDFVRGSWFGLGHVALAAGAHEQARTWFERVAALDEPLSSAARQEIALLDALAAPPTASKNTLTSAQAERIEAEATALLDRHGHTLGGARRAAERLRQLEDAGVMDAARMQRLLPYGGSIIGQDVGPLGLLVSAEDALKHEQFITSADKYRAFFATLDADRQPAFAAYRMRFVDALMRSGLVPEAIAQLEADRYPSDADHDLRRSLLHLARAIQYAATGANEERRSLAALSQQASDAGARYVRALFAGDTAKAHALWQSASKNPWIERLPVFELAWRELQRAGTDVQATDLATLGLELRAALLPAVRQAPWALLAEAEMQGFSDPEVATQLRRLDRLAKILEAEASDYQDSLFAVRVAFLRREAPSRLLTELEMLRPPLRDSQRDALVGEVLVCDPDPWCVPATERLAALLLPQSQALLLVRIQQVRLALRDDDAYPAFQMTSNLLEDYPDSGDLWLAHAEAAAQIGRAGDADAAYGRVADSLPVGSEAWRDARRQQLGLRLKEGVHDAACRLKALTLGDAQLRAEIEHELASRGIACHYATRAG